MWFNSILDFYKKGYYTEEQIQFFVSDFITQEEYNKIINTVIE